MDFAAVRAALAARDVSRLDAPALAKFAQEQHPAAIARHLEAVAESDDVPAGTVWDVLRRLPIDRQAEIFQHFSPVYQVDLAEAVARRHLADVMTHMSADDRVDLYNNLPADQQTTLLPALAQAEREDIRRLSSYAEGTAGAIMTSEYPAIGPELTARQAIDRLRTEAPDKETIYEAYVIDAQRRLVGSISLQKLITATPNKRVANLMRTEPLYAHVQAPQEDVARMIGDYDLIALPIVDDTAQLVGIVTHDDALDVVEEEATEDFHRVATVSPLGGSVMEARGRVLYRKRVGWLLLLVLAGAMTGSAIELFESTLEAHLALAFFLPLLVDSSGNSGSQSATLMVRALATGDVQMKDWGRLFLKELGVAVALGSTMAVVVAPLGLWHGDWLIAVVVGLTMIGIITLGCLVGMSLPFVLRTLGLDPATASAPLVTTICDILGVLLYFSLATLILPMV